MRIDSHQHFWKYDPGRDGWITDQMAVLKHHFLPDTLIPLLRANGIDGCIAVQADQSERETDFLLDLADGCPEIVGVVGWVDLQDENIRARLKHFSQYRKLRGFRHIVQAEPDDRFLLRNNFLRGVEALEEFGFTYDILIYARHLPAATEFVRHFPRQKFVVDHLAKPDIRAHAIELWGKQIRAMAENPNVFCKVSGMVVEAHWQAWTSSDFVPYLDVVFGSFGTDRVMFGSDWPVCLLAASYVQVKNIVEDYMRDLSANQKEKIFGLNAARFYGLTA